MKRIAALIILLFAASVARADNIVSVELQPFTFTFLSPQGGETIGATFLWDTTTDVLSNFAVSATGPCAVGLGTTPISSSINEVGISIINISDPAGDLFQVNSNLHGGIHEIGSTPGTYTTDLFFSCGACAGMGEGTAIVKAVSTPEPNTFTLLVGALGLFAFVRFRRRLGFAA